jgi:hypothetical protein
VLEESEVSLPEIERLKPARAMVDLIRHSYAAGLIPIGSSASHFAQCATLARSVPVSRLIRALRLPELADVARLVERDRVRTA